MSSLFSSLNGHRPFPRRFSLENWRDDAGAITVEYALVVAIVVVGLIGLLAPDSELGVFGAIRAIYQRMEIVIGMPWL